METEAETPEPISLEQTLPSGSVGNFSAEDSVLAQNAMNAISNPETEGKVGFSDGESFLESPSLEKVTSEEICKSYKDCEEKDISVLKMHVALDDEIQIQKDQPNECLAPIGVTETSLENAKTKSNELAETSELEKLQVQPVTSFVDLNLQEENIEGNDGKFTEDEKPKARMENQPKRDHQLVETFEVSPDETMMEATSAKQNSQEKKAEFSPWKEEIEGKKPNEDQDLKSGDETLQTVMETLCQDQEDAPLASDSMNLLIDAGVAGETRDMEESMEKRMEKEACNKNEGRSNNMDILSIPIKQDTNETSFLEDEKQERSSNLEEMRTCPEPMNEKEEIQNEKNVSVEDSLDVSMATRSTTSPTIQNNEEKILDADDKTSQTLDISSTAMVMEETSSLKAGAEEKCPPESTSSHLLEEISLKIDSIKKMNDDNKVDLDGEIQENYTERVKYTDEDVSTQISGKESKMEQLKRPAEVVCEDPETTAAERETLEKEEGQSNVERSIMEEIEGGETNISYDHRTNEAIMNKNPEPDELSDKTETTVAEEQEKISDSEPAGASLEKENIGEVIDRKSTGAIIIEHEKTTDAATTSGYMQTSDMGKLESEEKSENINAKEIRDVCTMEEFSESYLYKGEDRIIQEDVDVNDQNITLPGFQTYDSSCQEGEKEKDRVEEQTPEVKHEDQTFKARFADDNGISKEEGNEELKIINEETETNKIGEASEVVEIADAETDTEEHITEEATNRDVSVTCIAEVVKDCYQNDEGHERLKTAGEGEVSEMQIKEDVSVRDLSTKSIGEKTVDTISQEYEVSKGNEISDADKAMVEQRMEVVVPPVSASEEMAVENDASEEEQGLMRNFNERSKEEREETETKLIDDTGENETPKEEVVAHLALLEQNLKPVDSIDKIGITEVMSQNKDVNDVSLAKDVTTDGPEENFHEESKALPEEAHHSVKACEVSKNTELAITEQEDISVGERISEFIQTSETESVKVGKSSNSKEEVENIADKEEHIVESITNKEQHSNETECKDIEDKNLGEDGLINDHKTASLRDDMVDQRCHEDEKEVHVRTEKMDAGDDTKINKEIGAVRNIKKTTEESPENDKKEGKNPKEEVTEDLYVIRMSKDSEEITHEHEVIVDQLKVNVREEVRQIFPEDEKETKKLGKEVLGEVAPVTACKYTKEKTMEDSIATEAYTASTEEVVQESSHEEEVHDNLETSEAEAVHKQIMQDVTVPHLYTTSLGEETIKKSSEENELCEEINTASAREDTGNQITKDRTDINAFMVPSYEQTAEESGWGDEKETKKQQEVQDSDSKSQKGATDSIKEIDLGLDEEFKKEISNVSNLLEEPSEEIAQKKNIESPSHATLVCAMSDNEEHGITQNHVLMGHSKTLVMEEAEKSHSWKDEKEAAKSEKDFYKVYPELETTIGSKDIENITNENKDQILTEKFPQDETEAEKLKGELVGSVDTASSSKDIENVVKESSNEEEVPELRETTNTDGIVEKQIREDMTASLGEETKTEGSQENKLYEEVITAETKEDVENQTVKDEIDTEKDKGVPRNEKTLNKSIERLSHASSVPALSEEQIKEIPKEKETASNNHKTASITMTTEEKDLYGTELEGEVLVNASHLASKDISPSPAEASLRNSQDLHVQDMKLEKISNSVENVTGEILFSEKSGADEAKQELPSNGSMTLQTDQDTGITAVVEIVASNSFSDGKLEKKLECEILSTEKSGADEAKQEMGDMPSNGSVALPADQDIGTTAVMEMSARTSLSNEKLGAKLKEEVLLTEKSDASDAKQELPNDCSMTLPTDQDTGTTAAVEIGASNSFSDEKSDEKLQCENLVMEKSGAGEAKQEKDEMKSNGSTALPADQDTETSTAVEMDSNTSSLDGKLERKSEGEVLLTEKLGEDEAKQEMPRDGIAALATVVTETVASNSFSDDKLEEKSGEVLLAKDLGHEAKQELPSDGSMTQPTDQDTTSEKKSECEILSTEKSGVNEVKQEMDEMSSDGSALPADQDTGTTVVMEIADSNSYSDEKLEGKSEGEVLLLEKSDADEAKQELPSDGSTILPTDQDTGTTAAVEIAASNSFSDERSEEKSQCEIFSTEKSGADEAEQEMHEIKCDGSEALPADQDTETTTVVEIAASNSFSDEKSQEPLMPISDDHEFELLKEIKIENDTPVEDLLCENLKSPVEAQIEEKMDMQMEEATNLGEGSEDIGRESLILELDSEKLSSEPKDVILNGHNLIEVTEFCKKNKSETPEPGLEKAMSEGEDQFDVLSNEAEATGAYANLKKDVLKKEDPIKDIDQAFDASRNEGMTAEDMLVEIKAKDHNHETKSFDVTDYENLTQTLEVIDPSGKLEHASGSLMDHDLSPKTLPETKKTELEERERVKDQDAIFVKNQVHDQCLAEEEKEGRDLEKERCKFISNDKSDGANEPMKNITIIEKISDGTWKNDESETAGGEMTKQEAIAKYVKLFGAKDSGLSTEENVEASYCNKDTGIENWSFFEHLIKKANAYPEEKVSREEILKKESHKILKKDSIAASQVSEENIEAETIGNAEDLVEKLYGEPVIVETNETRIQENESRGEEITETLVVGFEENIQETYETIDKNTKNDNIINTNFEIASNLVFDHPTIENEDEDEESQTVEKPGADDGIAPTGKHDIEKDAPVENVESFKKDEEAIETISLQDVAENKNLKEDTETLNLGEKIETAELDSSKKKIDDLPNLTIKHASAEETLVGEVDGGCEEFPNFESHKLEVGLDSMSEAQVQEPLNVANEIEYHKRIVNGKNSDNLSVNDGSSGKTFQEDRDGDEHVMEAEHNLKLTARDKQIEETTEVSISHENASASKNIRKSGNDKNDGEYETKGEGNTEESSNLVSEKLIHKLDAEEFQGQKIYYEKEDTKKDILNQKGSCSSEQVLVEPNKETADLTTQIDKMAMKDGEEKSRIVDAPPARNAPSDEAPEDLDKNLENRMPEELVHETIDENAEGKGIVTKDASTPEGLLEVQQASESAPPISNIEELHREELFYDSGGVTSVKEAAQKEVHGKEEKTAEGVEIQERELVKRSTNDVSLPAEVRAEAIQDEAPVEEIIDEGVNQIDDLSIEDSVCTNEEVETHKLNERNLQETTMLEQTSELTNEKHIHTEAVIIENPETETPITSRALKSTPANLIGDSLTKEENQKDGQALVMESELKEVESVGVSRVQDLKEDTITKLKSSDSDNVSLSDVVQQSTKDSRQMVEYQVDEKKTSTNKEELEMKEAPTIEFEEEKAGEAKNDQNEEEEEHKKADPISDSPIMVEASRDVDVKSTPKKSHNILSGVGSKVKHSISKVKKAITGKSSHHKQLSPNK